MDRNLRVSPGKSLFMLVCWWVLLTIVGSLAIGAIGTETVGALRWAIVVQDITVFILPVALTMAICSTNPKSYIAIDRAPGWRLTGMAALTALVSIPAMNRLVAWNESITFPQSLAGLESILRDSENAAQAMVANLMGGDSVMDLVLAVLIMGVLTGIAEELFFRGGLQRLFISKFGNRHLAVWAAAFIFSAVHLQFFGFIPRLLMGAYFGYLVVWSGSLGLSMFAHAFNNSLVVVNFWLMNRGTDIADLNEIGAGSTAGSIIAASASLIVTVVALFAIYRYCYSLKSRQ